MQKSTAFSVLPMLPTRQNILKPTPEHDHKQSVSFRIHHVQMSINDDQESQGLEQPGELSYFLVFWELQN